MSRPTSFLKPIRLRLSICVSLLLIVTMLSQMMFVAPVQSAGFSPLNRVTSVVDTSSPAQPYVIGGVTPSNFTSSIASLLAFATGAAKTEPKSETAVDPVPSAPPPMQTANDAEFAALRLKPGNATGGTNLYSRNFGWGTSLVGLPGRAGLDAGFGISYNSLVWIKDPNNNEIIFDPDTSNVSPGFKFGFPTIEPPTQDPNDQSWRFLMIGPDGSRTDFRQDNGSTEDFHPGDSTYRHLFINSSEYLEKNHTDIDITVVDTSGTRMHYIWNNGAYRCYEIKDRNGNYISIDYNSYGRMTAVTDTLGRVITINYDTGGYPTTIQQTWKDNNGSGSNTTHTWATLSYTNATVSATFSGGLTVIGPSNSSTVKVLEKITYADSSFTKFEYNGYIQVKKIVNHAPDSTSGTPHVLNYVSTNLDSVSGTQSDCPRLSETRSWVENFNLSGGTPQEVVVTNSLTTGATYSLPNSITGSATRIDVAMTGHPDGLYSRTYVGASGYKEGLTLATEDCTGTNCATRLRWTWTDWAQDNTSASYITNPRVVEARVGDGTNTKRTTVSYLYDSITGVYPFGLPITTKVYDTNLSTVLKTQTTSYELSNYISRNIIGLPSEVKLYEGTDTSGTLMSKVTYTYDEGNMTGTDPVQNISPVGHDNTNYSSSFVTGRGLLTTVTRWDATDPTTSGSAVSTTMKYNTAGALVSKTTPWYSTTTRTVKISYTDNFNSTPGVSTYAYPTTLTDPNAQSSTVKYRYDIGANVEANSPAPAGQTYGKTSQREYETTTGRLLKDSVLVNTAAKYYTRYEYPTNGVQSKVFSTIIDKPGSTTGPDTADEVLSESWTDGAGRVRLTRTPHTWDSNGDTATWAGVQTEYDILGRVYRTSVPTETNSSWAATGDDSTRGWVWNYSYYDWKGRTTRTVPSDSTGSDGKDTLISYAGCGCAGGQTTTIEGPSVPRDDTSGNARRKQKITEDILGRNVKTEVFQWDGSTVYTSTVNTFNGRDQVTNTRQYSGTTTSSTYQDVTMTYDGHGRMATRRYPIEDTGTHTSWTYNKDDSISQIVDPRGAITDFTYNSRGLTTQMAYTPFSGGVDTPTVDFTYDNLGNRTSMDTAGVSEIAYAYDSLSRMSSETVDFDDISANKTISYTYNLSGGLASITDPAGSVFNYTNDKTGRLTEVKGANYPAGSNQPYANNIKYRAFGEVKQIDYVLPNASVAAMKMEFDSGLRVNHYEATQAGSTTSFVMKADYTFANDGRTTAKNDLLADRWDSTMKYDFAARMTFNQFGMGPASDPLEPDKRVYEQTLTYDAFSNMTTRAGVHWDNSIGMSETYTNGRINAGTTKTMTYDAAGNLTLSKPDVNAAHDFQENTFDAAGRRTLFRSEIKGHGGSYLNYVTETKEEKVFDGDGRPAYSKSGSRGYNLSSPPSGSLTTSLTNFAVYSTVLGQMLTELAPDGSKIATNIYAGGAMIGKQGATYTSGGSTYDNPDLETADPVTGTNAHFTYDPAYGTNAYAKNIEPLGQDVSSTDPIDYGGPPSQSLIINSAGEPEWQCTVAKGMGSSFSEMPYHCQQKALQAAGSYLPWEGETKSTPVYKEPSHRHDDEEPIPQVHEKALRYGIKSSHKPIAERASLPKIDIGKFDVNVPISMADEVLDAVDASIGGDDDDDKKKKPKEAAGSVSQGVDCSQKLLTEVDVNDGSSAPNNRDKKNIPYINTDMLNDFNAAMADITANIGPIGFSEMFRDFSRQQYLFNEKKAGRNKYAVAAPGTSNHEAGFAFDIPDQYRSMTNLQGTTVEQIFLAHNFEKPVRKDFVHFAWKNRLTGTAAITLNAKLNAWFLACTPGY